MRRQKNLNVLGARIDATGAPMFVPSPIQTRGVSPILEFHLILHTFHHIYRPIVYTPSPHAIACALELR
jgi:hypothetical protein